MFQSKSDPSRKFGSAFRQRAFDSYHDGEQPGESNENEHSTSKEEGASAADVVAKHGPATTMQYSHDHDGGKHTLSVTHPDGHTHQSVHSSAAEAYEAGGDKAWTDVKREDHPDQQGARSEEMNYENTETA